VPDDVAIEASGLRKSYGDVRALDGVDLRAPAGTVLGLLGPNGAGKTTAVRILTTLLRADGGSARVAGLDVEREAAALRSKIGLAGQYAAVDENLTRSREPGDGRPASTTCRRGSRASAPPSCSSASASPTPPTASSAPTRAGCAAASTWLRRWPADRLADRIAVIDSGRLLAEGTSDELKDRFGGERLDVTLEDRNQFDAAVAALEPIASGAPSILPSGAPSASRSDSARARSPARSAGSTRPGSGSTTWRCTGRPSTTSSWG